MFATTDSLSYSPLLSVFSPSYHPTVLSEYRRRINGRLKIHFLFVWVKWGYVFLYWEKSKQFRNDLLLLDDISVCHRIMMLFALAKRFFPSYHPTVLSEYRRRINCRLEISDTKKKNSNSWCSNSVKRWTCEKFRRTAWDIIDIVLQKS